MDMKTTARVDFQPFSVIPQQKPYKPHKQSNAPIAERSAYKSEYPNWGASDHLIEKTPQYPVYSLPFKGQSVYAETFQNSKQ